jgi:predicted deacylase
MTAALASPWPLLVLTLAIGAVQAPQPFAIADRSVAAGQRLDFDLPVAAGVDAATRIPITVFHGARPGPVLALTAGVHGYEFATILAGQRLLDRIDPAQLRGTVILVRLANVESFEQRVPYVNPTDRKNLNRVFPGKADGTQTDRMAWAITNEVIRRSDAHIELHGGDGAEWMEPFAGLYGGKLAATQYETSKAMGLAFGFRNVVKYSMDRQEQVDSGRSLNRQAVADAKPTVLIEIGENGRRDDAFVEPVVDGILNVLRVMKMVDQIATKPRADTRWLDNTVSVDAAVTGIFTPAATTGRAIKQGEPIGTIRDYTGRVIQQAVSPVDGYIMYGLAGPPVKAGDSLVTIGLPAKGPL